VAVVFSSAVLQIWIELEWRQIIADLRQRAGCDVFEPATCRFLQKSSVALV
jgi:hypothetical protein